MQKNDHQWGGHNSSSILWLQDTFKSKKIMTKSDAKTQVPILLADTFQTHILINIPRTCILMVLMKLSWILFTAVAFSIANFTCSIRPNIYSPLLMSIISF